MLETSVFASGENLKPGCRLGGYDLLATIGEGGMGRVWLAREAGANHLVAVKTSLVSGQEFWSVLLDEARIASRIHHPNVCAIHAADQQDGVVYLVMDWSDGGSLRELLDESEDRRLPVTVAARIASRIGSGLHAVHEVRDDHGGNMGVVHRDVSPQNVLIATTGQVRLTDFGIAKASGRLNAPTQTGQIKGKFSYMSPEQATSKPLDRRSDVFALGCVLYEMTTGRAPFRGADAVATMYQLLEQPLVLPSTLREELPAGLEAIIVKALERNTEKRFQTAEDFSRALERFLIAESVIITDEDVGKLIGTALPDRIAERSQRIEEATVRIDKDVLSRGAWSDKPEALRARPNSDPTVAHTPVAQNLPRPAARRRWMAFGGLGLAAGTVLIVLSVRTQSTEADIAPPVQTALTQAAAATAVSAVSSAVATNSPTVAAPVATLTLSATPPSVRWQLDDGPALPNPTRLFLPNDGAVHVVTASAPGYVAEKQEVMLTSDSNLTLALVARRPVSSRVKQPKEGSPAAASASVPPATAQAPSASTARAATSSPGKGVRQLDQKNPFAP